MEITGSRVGVIGGSIAGCATAIALSRLGCQVDVFERSSGALRDRGSGIAIPIPLRNELVDAGYLPDDYPTCVPQHRRWVLADGSPSGRVLWQHGSAAAMSNWGVLWRSLRSRVADDRYHDRASVAAITPTANGATLAFADRSTQNYDVVIGADGYNSTARSVVSAQTAPPEFAGYILWRGNFPERQLTDRAAIERLDADRAWLTVPFEGGHAVMYPIPDFDGDGRRINWAIYAPIPNGLSIDGTSSIPPGRVEPHVYGQLQDLIQRVIPPDMWPLFESARDEVSIQPIYDAGVERYVCGRIALIGDAGTVTRPHTGSGATKAMQDARTLELLGAERDNWDDLLTAYDADRVGVGTGLVELGRRIGRDQVTSTPSWASMSPADFENWSAATLSGERLYFWDDADSET